MAVNFINKYPYTDFHELNLDWIIGEMSKKAAGRWATVTIHPDEWDNDGICVVTGITGMTPDTPFLWSWAPETVDNGLFNCGVVPVARGDEEITFAFGLTRPATDVTFFLLIGE